MKKTSLLHPLLSGCIAGMGHGDRLVICDAGLPIPRGPQRIDLALTQGVPRFLQTLEVILTELQVQEAIVATETRDQSPQILAGIQDLLTGVPITWVSHEELKALTAEARAVVRTGEFTPYANIILVSGVVF